MSDVNANIGINFETQKALASLRQLQAGLSRFNQALTAGNADAADAQKALNAQLLQSINATGKFVASIKNVSSSTTAFTDALEKNKLSMKEYFRYTAAAATSNTKTFSRFFASERQIFNRAAKDRVKALQTQYIQLTNANGDLVKVLQVVPKHLQGVSGEYADYATKVQMAAQRQQMMNQLIKQGSTQLLNFGKNTQWAGRQLMVGFTIPLMMLGGLASRTFMEMEKEVIKFRKVYGEMFTSEGDTERAVQGIQKLAEEFTKYGIAVKDTIAMASQAAAMGLSGAALTQQVTQATRLAVLGEVEQQQALETTISLQNAFGIATQDLANKINFLNAVENQTVTGIEDLTIAIPKAGPVIQQLGGSVEDLAFFLTAMKEGGINASEGANALKSGLASIINPTKQTSEMMAELGINIKGIVESNAGDLKATVIGVAQALDTLDPLNRARAIEQMFGKFQFARISALFANITDGSSQASRALQLASMSAEELAIVSERELSKVEESVGVKFQKTLEQLKVELMPLGKAFLEAVTPVVRFVGQMLDKFNNLSDGVKKAVAVVIGVIGGLAPVLLMSVGLVANGVANLIKFFGMLRGGMAKLNGQNNVLGGGFDYLTQQETENLAQSNALHTSHQQLIETFNVEKISVDLLADAYGRAASQARSLAASSPGFFNTKPGPAGAVSGLPGFADGGVVPGRGNKDTVPAMLTPGEVVLTKDTVKNNPELVAALQNGKIQGFNDGGVVPQSGYQSRITSLVGSSDLPSYLAKELQRIETLSESQLKQFAKNTGMATEATLEEIRNAVRDKFEQILQDVKAQTGSITSEGLTQVGKRYDPEKGYSPMGSYFSRFDQQQRPQFSHVGQTETVTASDLEKMNLTPEAKQGLDLLKELGMGSKDFRVADAYGFRMKGSINRAMADPAAAQNYRAKYNSDLNTDMITDFRSRGSEKWREMVDMGGGNFDELKSQLDVFDSSLAQEIQDWISAHPDGLISDEVVMQLASKVEADAKSIGPELQAVIQKAKDTITAIRVSMSKEELATANAAAEARGMGKSFYGPKTNNAKIANVEARTQGEVLGTGIINALEETTETESPSRKTIQIGKDVARGLSVGMQSEEANVRSQADKLAESSVPNVMKNEAVILGNTGDSSVAVLQNTEDLAESSGEAADAQRIHRDTVVTTGDIADAAANSTQDIATAANLGAQAQMDSAVTAQQIADKDQQILQAKEQQLQAIQNNNMEEMMNDGRLSQSDALKEASKFARDENGGIILGPNGPLTTKQIKDMKRGQRRMAVGRFSGKVSGGLGLATMAAGMMGAPPQVTAGLGVASMASQFAPMLAGLTGPQGIAVAAVAVAGGLFLLNKKFQSAAREQAKFVKEITATTEKMQKIGEFTGQVGASQLMQRRRETGFSGGYIPRERRGQEFGINFAEGELGQEMSKSFVKSIEKFGAKEAAKIFGLELAAYVSDGVLSAEQAQGIAFAIGSKMQDQTILVDIEGQLSNIIGMNGADITRDPLAVRVRLIAEADSQAQRALDEMKNIAQNTTVSGADEAARLAGFLSNSVSLAQAQADAMVKYYEDEKRVLEQQLKQTTNKEKQIEIQNKLNQLTQDAIDAEQILNSEVLKRLDQSVATFQQEIQTGNTGMFNDAARRETAFFDSLKQSVRSAYAGTGQEKDADRLLERTAKVSDEFSKQGFESFNEGQDFEVRMNMLVANKLVSPTQANAFMDLFAGNLKDLQTTLDIGIQSRGAAKTSELLGIMARFEDKSAAKTMAMNITMEDNETFDRLMNILGLANMLDGKEIDMDKMFGGPAGESRLRVLDDQFKALGEQADKLGDKEITTDFLVKFDQEYGTDTSKADLAFIQKEFAGDKKGQINALRTYQMISQYVNSMEFDSPEAKKMFEQEAERRLLEGFRNRENKSQTFEEYRVINYQLLLDETKSDFQLDKDGFIQTRFKAVIGQTTSVDPKIPPVTNQNTGKGSNPLDFLDELAMRIKNVRDGAFNATTPLKSMLAAFSSKKAQKDASKMFTIFDGLQQRLLKMKAPKEFRDMIMGMSSEDFTKLANLKGDKAIFNFEKGKPKTKSNIKGLTETGKALMQTYREAQLGEFNVVQKETVQNIKDQKKAFNDLIASGLTVSDALAVVEDQAVASAIAMGAVGKVGSAEMKQFVADIKLANEALEKQQLINNMLKKNEEFELYQKMPQLASTLSEMGMSSDQINEALSDPQLSKYLIEDLKDGKIDAKEIADYLNSIEARKIIDIQIKFNKGDFAGAAEEGRQLVDEMFSVQEALIRTGVDPRTTALVAEQKANDRVLKDLNLQLGAAQLKLAEMNEELSDGQRKIEENYNRPIEAMQEQVSDLERTLETHPIFGNRVIKGLQDESNKLSNDLQVIGFHTEKINEKYDKQAEALQKVSEINQNIIRQQQQQLGLADALTQGDIAAAARAAQEMRAGDAAMFADTATQALEQSRQNEINALRGPESGMSAQQIQDRQYYIAQEIYKLENSPERLAIQQQILGLQDQIYTLGEAREEQLLKLRDLEDAIYNYTENTIEPLQRQIDKITYRNQVIQDTIDKYVAEIEVLGKTRDEWDKINAKIDASALASKNLDAAFGALLASAAAIDAMWSSILAKMASYGSGAGGAVGGSGVPKSVTDAQKKIEETAKGDKQNAEKVLTEAEKLAAAQTLVKDLNAAAKEASGRNYVTDAEMDRSLAAADKKYGTNLYGGSPTPTVFVDEGAHLRAKGVIAPKPSGGGAGGKYSMQFEANGGLINPMKFAMGGFARGTDTVPAMLTPGEFVMSKYAVSSYGIEKMKAINSGDPIGDSVYNYSVNVSVQSDANPQQIADAVMRQIKQIDSQRIRGNRL